MNFMSLEALPGKVQLTSMNPPWGLASQGWREGRCTEAHLERGCVVSQGCSKTELCTRMASQSPNQRLIAGAGLQACQALPGLWGSVPTVKCEEKRLARTPGRASHFPPNNHQAACLGSRFLPESI
uniref:Uncharacterized protein n=1 Tax=Myotis myotis TaxID=51298 RepID=A0A7J7Y073_MYOMY|nr:hypothetical protein mMyoMyo1_011378 [Myotis myotis]